MLSGLFGNAADADVQAVQKELSALLVDGEQVVRAYQIVRDMFVFTDKRLILVDKQGMSGKKVEYDSIPYRAITHFSVETAGGAFDLDSEMKIYITGNALPVQREFKKGADINGVARTLAQFVLAV